MRGRCPRLDAVFDAGLLDEPAGESRVLATGDHPPEDVPAENVDQDVEVIVRSLLRSEQPGDVPRLGLVGGRHHELGLGVEGTHELIAGVPNGRPAVRNRYIVRSAQR